MINSCGLFSIKRDGVFNVPFVALDAEQALYIVCEAFKDLPFYELEKCELYRIGAMSFTDGIYNTDVSMFANAVEIMQKIDSLKEVNNEVSDAL